MHRIQVQLTPKQERALRQLSRLRGQSISALIREGVDLLTAPGDGAGEGPDPALALIGLLGATGGPSDVAENHDDYLAEIYAEKLQ
jgi:hypothetical protein